VKGGETSGLQHKGDGRIVHNGRYVHFFVQFLFDTAIVATCPLFVVCCDRYIHDEIMILESAGFLSFISTIDGKLVENHKNVQRKNISKKSV
jgi:hypothetical protein